MSAPGDVLVLPRFPAWSLPALGVPLLAMATGAAVEGFPLAAAGLAALVVPMLWALAGGAVLAHDRDAAVLRVTPRGFAPGVAARALPLAGIRGARAEPVEDSESLALVVETGDGFVRLCAGDPERVVEAARWVQSLRQRPGRKSSAAASD